MLQKSQFNIIDLQGFRRTKESLDRLLMRKDYHLGEATLSEKIANPNQTPDARKESMLAKACAELKIDNIIFEFKSINPALDKTAIDALNEQKQIIDMQLALKVYRMISQQLEKEAARIFAYEEKMKAYREAIQALLKQEESESQLRKLNSTAESKREIEEALFEMRKDIHDKTMKTLDDILEQVTKLSERYNEIQDLRIKNKKRHNDDIKNALNNYEIDGQKIFAPEQQSEIIDLLDKKNDLVNQIEALIEEEAAHEASLSRDTQRLTEVRYERSELEAIIADQRKQLTSDENKEINEYLKVLQDDAASEMEEYLCTEEMASINTERNTIKKSITSRTLNVAASAAQDSDVSDEPEIPKEVQDRLHKLDKKEDYLNQKMTELHEHRAYLARKKQEKEEKLKKIGKNDITNPTYFLNFSKLTLLRNEERELEQRIKRTHQRLTEVKAERSMLSEKLHIITDSLDHAFSKAVGFIKKTFGRNEGAKIKAIQAQVEDSAESSRQQDNALAAEAASCEQQMHNLVKQADAAIAVGASCGAMIGTAAPHSQHAATVAGFAATEQAKCAQIKATVGAALGVSLGASTTLRAS